MFDRTREKGTWKKVRAILASKKTPPERQQHLNNGTKTRSLASLLEATFFFFEEASYLELNE
jgi:hypothetical protein